MLELALAALLGFAASMFVVLLFGPAIARRISVLTWRQAEASLPMTMTEIAADRDRLRAEHAMAARVLEQKIEAAEEGWRKERLVSVRQRDEITSLEGDIAAAKARIAELDAAMAALDAERAELDARLVEARAEILTLEASGSALRIDLQEATREKERLSAALARVEASLARATTKADKLEADLSGAMEREKALLAERGDLRSRAKTAEADARLASGKVASLEKKLDQARQRRAELEDRLDRLTRREPATRVPLSALSAAEKPSTARSPVPASDRKAGKAEPKPTDGGFKPAVPEQANDDEARPEPARADVPPATGHAMTSDPVARFKGMQARIAAAPNALAEERKALRDELMQIAAEIVVEAGARAGPESQLATALGEARTGDAGLSGRIARAREAAKPSSGKVR